MASCTSCGAESVTSYARLRRESSIGRSLLVAGIARWALRPDGQRVSGLVWVGGDELRRLGMQWRQVLAAG